LVNSQEY